MEKIKSNLVGNEISSNSKSAHYLFEKSNFGEKIEDKVHYLSVEALFLLENKKLDIYFKNKKIAKQEFLTKLQKTDKKIQTKYLVFKDLRKKGYIVKTALKFGAEFRVYDKGKKPGQTHAKWLVSQIKNQTRHIGMNSPQKIESHILQKKIYYLL